MNEKQIDLIFILPDLSYGGSQKTFVNFINYFAKNYKELKIYLFVINNSNQIHKVDKSVKIFDFKSKNTRRAIFKIFFKLKKIQPKFVLSTIIHLNLASIIIKILLLNNKIKFIIRESNPTFYRDDLGFFIKYLCKILYPFSDKIICLSNEVKLQLINNIKNIENKTFTIFNPIDFKEIDAKSNFKTLYNFSKDKLKIIYVGRLSYQKNINLLINILHKLNNLNYEAFIIGDGNEKNEAMNLIKLYGLSDKIKVFDYIENPYPYIKQADIFILPSRWEGFGHVIVESIMCNTPVICLNTFGLAKEFLLTKNVLLFKESSDNLLATKIDEAISDNFHNVEINRKAFIDLFDIKVVSKELYELITAT